MPPTRGSEPSLITGASFLESRITGTFGFALLLMVIVGAITYLGLARIATSRAARRHAFEVRDRLGRLEGHLQEAETGQRGYLLTGRDPYLGPFETGTAAVRGDLDSLIALTADDSIESTQMRTLTPAIEAKLAELTLTVDLRRTQGPAAALRVVETDRGRVLMDSVRAVLGGIDAVERGRYVTGDAAAAEADAGVRAAIAAGTLLSLALLAFASIQVHRHFGARRRLDARLTELSAELNDLYERAPCGYHSLGTDGTVLRINQTECRWLGYEPDDLVGKKTVFDLLVPADRARARARFDQLVSGVDIGTGDARFLRKDGTVLATLVSSTLVRDASGAPWRVRATMMDQTAFRSAKEQVDRLNAQLQRHVGELEDVNDELEKFSYSVSHDLRAPLRAIAGFSRVLAAEHGRGLDAEGLRLLNVVQVNVERMGRLIDDLLALSRFSRQPLVRVPVDMAALVAAVIADRSAADAQTAELVVGDLPPAEGDPALLRQVWERLIDNGVKFTAGVPAPRVEIGARADHGTPVYTVRDNGVGFDMEYAEKVFEVFQRLHPQAEYEGTGVGLAIARRVIHRHGGRIWAEAAPGRGATFSFTLGAKGGA